MKKVLQPQGQVICFIGCLFEIALTSISSSQL